MDGKNSGNRDLEPLQDMFKQILILMGYTSDDDMVFIHSNFGKHIYNINLLEDTIDGKVMITISADRLVYNFRMDRMCYRTLVLDLPNLSDRFKDKFMMYDCKISKDNMDIIEFTYIIDL